jgi:DNA mismatch endonuclease (patch repair protein)
MASIRKRDTKPELVLRSALYAAGVRGWRCHAPMLGSPDIAFTRWRVLVFVDGVWWHGHPDYLPNGRRGPYWDQKIAGNIARDDRVNYELRAQGLLVLRLWDIDVMAEPAHAVAQVMAALVSRGWSPSRTAMADEVLIEGVPVVEFVTKPTPSPRSRAKDVAQQRGGDLRRHDGRHRVADLAHARATIADERIRRRERLKRGELAHAEPAVVPVKGPGPRPG